MANIQGHGSYFISSYLYLRFFLLVLIKKKTSVSLSFSPFILYLKVIPAISGGRMSVLYEDFLMHAVSSAEGANGFVAGETKEEFLLLVVCCAAISWGWIKYQWRQLWVMTISGKICFHMDIFLTFKDKQDPQSVRICQNA